MKDTFDTTGVSIPIFLGLVVAFMAVTLPIGFVAGWLARAPGRGAMSSQSNVLFDAPGPTARRRNNVLTLLAATAILGVAYFVYSKFDEKGQWSGRLWRHFLHGHHVDRVHHPGLTATLKAAALGAVFALVFGAAFGVARLSDHRLDPPAGRGGGGNLPSDSAAPVDLLHRST